MRTTGWFAAICASFGFGIAAAADGLDLAARSHAAAQPASAVEMAARAAPTEQPARVNLPSLGRDPLVENALRSERRDALARTGCRLQDVCYEAAEGRVVYRGARRYMPSWQGMQPEGISLRRDRLLLRYSFR